MRRTVESQQKRTKRTNVLRKPKFQADLAPVEDTAVRALKEELQLTSNSDFLSEALALRLAHTVGFSHNVRVDGGHGEAARVVEGKQCLVQIRQTREHCTPISTTADDQDANRALQQLRVELVSHCRVSSVRK